MATYKQTNQKKEKKKKKENTYRPYIAMCIVCSIGLIPGKLFVAESKETKIF